MRPLTRSAIPWILAVVALWPAAVGLAVSAPAACDELPSAFRTGVDTEWGDTLSVVASHCQTTHRTTGHVAEVTAVNWSGLAGAAATVVGAWMLGALIVGTLARRTAAIGLGVCALVTVTALAAFFI